MRRWQIEDVSGKPKRRVGRAKVLVSFGWDPVHRKKDKAMEDDQLTLQDGVGCTTGKMSSILVG